MLTCSVCSSVLSKVAGEEMESLNHNSTVNIYLMFSTFHICCKECMMQLFWMTTYHISSRMALKSELGGLGVMALHRSSPEEGVFWWSSCLMLVTTSWVEVLSNETLVCLIELRGGLSPDLRVFLLAGPVNRPPLVVCPWVPGIPRIALTWGGTFVTWVGLLSKLSLSIDLLWPFTREEDLPFPFPVVGFESACVANVLRTLNAFSSSFSNCSSSCFPSGEISNESKR